MMHPKYLLILLMLAKESICNSTKNQLIQQIQSGGVTSIEKLNKLPPNITQARYQAKNRIKKIPTTTPTVNYFPDVEYPANIIDSAKPFYFKAIENSALLSPFPNDVQSYFQSITTPKDTEPSSNIQNTKYLKYNRATKLKGCPPIYGPVCFRQPKKSIRVSIGNSSYSVNGADLTNTTKVDIENSNVGQKYDNSEHTSTDELFVRISEHLNESVKSFESIEEFESLGDGNCTMTANASSSIDKSVETNPTLSFDNTFSKDDDINIHNMRNNLSKDFLLTISANFTNTADTTCASD